MADEISTILPPHPTTLTIEVEAETRQLLEAAAVLEGRSLASVLTDAIQLYLRSRSEGYRAHLETARRFLDAPEGSDERALDGAALSAGLAREHGRVRQERGGDATEVRARLRRRQTQMGDV